MRALILCAMLLATATPTLARDYPPWIASQMPDTMHLLAGRNHYRDGFYVAAGEKWELASMYGNLAARVELGVLYAEGKLVEQDLVSALAWFELASMTKATPWRIQAPIEELRAAMTSEEIAAADTLVAELAVVHGPDAVESRILKWLRREKHKNRGQFSFLQIHGHGAITRDKFFRELNRYVRDIYLPETEVILRDLILIDDD